MAATVAASQGTGDQPRRVVEEGLSEAVGAFGKEYHPLLEGVISCKNCLIK